MSTLLFLPVKTVKYYIQPFVYILPHLNKKKFDNKKSKFKKIIFYIRLGFHL